MKSLRLIKTPTGLVPADGLAQLAYDKIKLNAVHEYSRKTDRSTKQLRLYWAAIDLIIENLDSPTTSKALSNWTKIKCGLVEPVPLRSGAIDWVVSSIALEEMEHVDFQDYFNRAKDFWCQHIIPGLDKAELTEAAQELLGEAA